MHPDCVHATLLHWMTMRPDLKDQLEYVFKTRKRVHDFITFTMAECQKWMDWESPDGWAEASKWYRNHKRKEFARKRMQWELSDAIDKAGGIVNYSAAKAGIKHTDNPERSLWARECIQYLNRNHGEVISALVLEIIEPFDAARLKYDGDLDKTRAAFQSAINDLRHWLRY